uniref:Uncharacterized protein n=1 Tax=Mesocestoides corti TaxID=53468 RepID=A0A5K3G7S2_MESCO
MPSSSSSNSPSNCLTTPLSRDLSAPTL